MQKVADVTSTRGSKQNGRPFQELKKPQNQVRDRDEVFDLASEEKLKINVLDNRGDS